MKPADLVGISTGHLALMWFSRTTGLMEVTEPVEMTFAEFSGQFEAMEEITIPLRVKEDSILPIVWGHVCQEGCCLDFTLPIRVEM